MRDQPSTATANIDLVLEVYELLVALELDLDECPALIRLPEKTMQLLMARGLKRLVLPPQLA